MTDTLTTGSLLSEHSGGSGTLISAGGRFELGFFPGPPGHRRYIGIWYHTSVPPTVVWVANRDKPLMADRTGIFTIAEDDGNLKVLDGNNNTYFSTSSPSPGSRRRTVKLLDSGNLVLSDHDLSSGGSTSTVLWQSFDHPTDTFLPGMKMDENLKLTSWTTDNDPRSGDFTFKKDELEAGENHYNIIWKETIVYWKTGETSSSFITSSEMPFLVALLLSNFSKQTIHKLLLINGNLYTFHTIILITQFSDYNNNTRLPDYNNTRILMNSNGKIQFLIWDNDTTKGARGWSLIWSEPRDQCSVYNACGNFGSCNSNRTSPAAVCKCLAGFEPSLPDNWNSGDFSKGCTRKTPRPCDNNTEFLNLTRLRVRRRALAIAIARRIPIITTHEEAVLATA